MHTLRASCFASRRWVCAGFSLLFAVLIAAPATGLAQSCLTQAKMMPQDRTAIGTAAFRLAAAVLAGDTATVQAATIAQYANTFTQTAYLIRNTSAQLTGDQLAVTQIYALDATKRTANDNTDADFNCPLSGTAAETDFSIAGLPPGRYAFAMVQANGPSPWLLSFLLQADSDGTHWKMAGFYPHRRDAAGHDGLWYWNTARADAKANKAWLAWLLYGEADQLLRPAAFVSTTNLDRLRSELRSATPPTLTEGISATTPLALAGPGGADFRLTGLSSEASEDGKQLNLIVHVRADASTTATDAATTRNLAVASALLTAHPELRTGFDQIWVIAEAPGTNPFVTERPIAEIATSK